MSRIDNSYFPTEAIITGQNVGHGVNFIVTAKWREDLGYWVTEYENGEIGSYSHEQVLNMLNGKSNTEQYIYNVEFVA
jgi:hypothetical protein